MQAGAMKGSVESKRTLGHAPSALPIGNVQYRLQPLPGRTGRRCARVVPSEQLNLAAFLRRLCERNPGLSPATAKYYLETAFAELAECLREGRFVTFDGIAQFGCSIKGEVAEAERQLNRAHTLRPWARFLQPFANALNSGAYLQPCEGLPVRMVIERTACDGQGVALFGRFRSPERAQFEVQTTSGKTVACALVAADTSTSRHECTRLMLRAASRFAATGATLVVRYAAADGSAREQRVALG